MGKNLEFKSYLLSEIPKRMRKKLLFNLRIMSFLRMVTKQKAVTVLYSNGYDTYILVAQEKDSFEDIEVNKAEGGFLKGITLHYRMSSVKCKEPIVIKNRSYIYYLIKVTSMYNIYSGVELRKSFHNDLK